MDTHHDIIREIDEYCERAGITPSTLCRYATGNTRLRDRLARRLEKTDADVSALREYMSDHPVDAPRSEAG